MCLVGGRKRKKLHGVCVYAGCRIGTGLCQLCLSSNQAQRQPETEAPVYQWQPVYVETSVYGIHASTFHCVSVITYPQIHVYIYMHVNTSLGTVYSLAISGHHGSSLSHKHWLCVSASLKTPYTQLHSKQGKATPPVVGVQKLDRARPRSRGFAKKVELLNLKIWFGLYTEI